MTYISTHEADNGLLLLLEHLDPAGELVITKGGEPVARLVPAVRPASAAYLVQKAQELRDSIVARGERFTWEELKAFRDEGRP